MIVFVVACALLYHVSYEEAKESAIAQLNGQQMIHAKQAAQGIEDYFTTWIGILTSLARMQEIVDHDFESVRDMELLYEAHKEQIKSVTRVNEQGTIIYTFPHKGSVGTNIAHQKHIDEILRNHQAVVSDVFHSIQGFDAIAVHVPVFKGTVFHGTLAIVLDFQSLAKRYLEVIKIGETGYAWVLSRDGTTLYSPIPGFTGKSVFDNCKDFPSIVSLAESMLKGRQGVATYTFDRVGIQTVAPVKKFAVYLPIHLGNTFWSIAVASSEEEVLASLTSFRNKLIAVLVIILVGGLFFSVLSAKAWFVVKEEAGRRQAEAGLRASEQRYRELFDNNPAPMLIYERGTLQMLTVNDAFVNHYGYTREEALALVLTDLYPDEEKMPIRELAAQLHGQAYVGEWHHRKADGSIITIVARSHDIMHNDREARIAVITDITDRKQIEEALQVSEARYRSVVENIGIGIAVISPDLHIQSMNRQMTKWFPDLDLASCPVCFISFNFPPRADACPYCPVVLTLQDGEVHESITDTPAGDQTLHFRIRSSPIKDEEGKVVAAIEMVEDITDRQRAEEELQKLNETLDQRVRSRTEELERKNAELARFNKLFVDREFRIKELKDRVKELETKLTVEDNADK